MVLSNFKYFYLQVEEVYWCDTSHIFLSLSALHSWGSWVTSLFSKFAKNNQAYLVWFYLFCWNQGAHREQSALNVFGLCTDLGDFWRAYLFSARVLKKLRWWKPVFISDKYYVGGCILIWEPNVTVDRTLVQVDGLN